MFQEIIDLLYHPDIFFERRNKEKINLVIPAIIVGIGGIVSLITPMVQQVFMYGGDLSNFIVMPSAIIVFLVLPFIIWFMAAELRVRVSTAYAPFPGCDH